MWSSLIRCASVHDWHSSWAEVLPGNTGLCRPTNGRRAVQKDIMRCLKLATGVSVLGNKEADVIEIVSTLPKQLIRPFPPFGRGE